MDLKPLFEFGASGSIGSVGAVVLAATGPTAEVMCGFSNLAWTFLERFVAL